MCKYCERIPNVDFCEPIVDTGFETCAIFYDNGIPFIGLSGDSFASSEQITYCPFCGTDLCLDDLFEDDGDEDNVTYEQIDISDVKAGDYIAIDGESSFCHFGYHLIGKVVTKYNEDTGQQYKLLIDEDDYEWNSSTGYCRNGLYAYYIVGFYRKTHAKGN